MPPLHRLFLPLATAALLSAGAAHAEARRSAQSLPASVRFSTPAPTPLRAPVNAGSPARTNRDNDARNALARSRSGGRDDFASRGHGDRYERGGDNRGQFDNRRHQGPRDWHDYEKGKDNEGHHFGHHDRDDDKDHGHGHDHDHDNGHNDSPGC